MANRVWTTLAISGLVAAGVAASSATIAGEPTSKQAKKQAEASAGKAGRALAGSDAAQAIAFAETAVTLAPQSAEYRLLLGQSYLQAGRFVSARAAFDDALQLSPASGKAALKLALAQVATGDAAAARQTLDRYATVIPVGDLGLAIALAGDPAGAVTILTTAVRQSGGDAKLRQNLALSLALAGQWTAARIVAAVDLSPADLDARMAQWAAFAQPSAAGDQVAMLLGVRSVSDAGQPIALALNAAVPVAPVAAAEPVPSVAPVAMVATVPVIATPVLIAPVQPPLVAKVVFAPLNPVVQPLPTPLLRAEGLTKLPLMAAATPARVDQFRQGDWYVQIGAYANAAVARDGWARARRRFAGFADRQPTGMAVSTRRGGLYRLSVGGYARSEAHSVCRRYRSNGGACFVRLGAGDQTALWLRKGSATPKG